MRVVTVSVKIGRVGMWVIMESLYASRPLRTSPADVIMPDPVLSAVVAGTPGAHHLQLAMVSAWGCCTPYWRPDPR